MIGALLLATTLTYTVPSHNSFRMVIPEEERDSFGDSIAFDCGREGEPTSDVAWVTLWWQRVTGGPFEVHHLKSVLGREGQVDTFLVDPGPGAHFAVTVSDTAGNHCSFSNVVYIPGTVTGVATIPIESITVRHYDIQGRLVKGPPKAVGIYFFKAETHSHVWTGRVVVMRRGVWPPVRKPRGP